MGSQQLLLLVLGLIVVMSMIYIGTALYNEYVVSSNRDQLISTLNTLADMCQTHYKKPVEMGGGEGEYTGWILPNEFSSTDIGVFNATVKKNKINIKGTGVENGFDGRRKVIVQAVINANGTTIQVKN